MLKLTISSPRSCSWTFSAEATVPTLAINFERSFSSVPVTAWASIAALRSAEGARWYVLLSA